MSAPPDIRSQLRSLSIPKEQKPLVGVSTVRRPTTVAPRQPLRVGRWIKPLLVVAVLAGLSWGGYLVATKLSNSSGQTGDLGGTRLLTVQTRSQGDAPPIFTASGKIVSDHKVQVSTKVSGQIVALLFEQGDRVKKDQTLARIEDVIYRARRDQAAAQLDKTKANLAFQKINFERIERLYNNSNAPEMEYTDAKRAAEESAAQLEADRASLAYAEKSLADCTVAAPISGVILERNVEVGDFVAAEGGRGANANAQFGAIADMTALRVEVDVSELDIARVKNNMPCQIKPDAYKDRHYDGHVMWIDPGANYSKATVQLKVRIDNPDDFLRVEGSAQVAFLSEAPSKADANAQPRIWIPVSAIMRDPGASTGTVYVAAENKLHRHTVKTARESGGQIEILDGLSAGQQILADGIDKAAEGQSIIKN